MRLTLRILVRNNNKEKQREREREREKEKERERERKGEVRTEAISDGCNSDSGSEINDDDAGISNPDDTSLNLKFIPASDLSYVWFGNGNLGMGLKLKK